MVEDGLKDEVAAVGTAVGGNISSMDCVSGRFGPPEMVIHRWQGLVLSCGDHRLLLLYLMISLNGNSRRHL